jgi:hypothetical protein
MTWSQPLNPRPKSTDYTAPEADDRLQLRSINHRRDAFIVTYLGSRPTLRNEEEEE